MQNIIKNIIAGGFSLIPVFPLIVMFDVLINAFLNPSINSLIVNEFITLSLGGFFMLLIILTPMFCHNHIMNLDI